MTRWRILDWWRFREQRRAERRYDRLVKKAKKLSW